MKNYPLIRIATRPWIIIFVLLNSSILFSQWGPDVRLTNDPGLSYPSYNNARNIAAKGDTVHTVWFDNRSGYYEIYYKRSTDRGQTWEPDKRLTNAPLFSGYASLAVSGNMVHVTWYDERDGNYEIYYKRSTDSGMTWEEDLRLTDDPGSSGFPFIAVNDTILHVVWQDDRNGNPEIYYKQNLTGNPVTGISNGSVGNSSAVSLEQNCPNPFNTMTNIKFQLTQCGNTRISVYDVFGKEAAVLVNEKLQRGHLRNLF